MSEATTPEKRLIVLTKESTFYAPEDASPPSSPYTPKSALSSKNSTPLIERTLLGSTPGKDTEVSFKTSSPQISPSKNLRFLYLFGLCVVLLCLLGILLAIFNKDTGPLHSMMIAGVGVALGYTISYAQGLLR